MKILKGQELEAIERNKKLNKISNLIDEIDQRTTNSHLSKNKLNTEIDTLIEEFPELSINLFSKIEMRTYIKKLAKQLKNSKKPNKEKVTHLIQDFFDSFPKNERKYAFELFEIGKASYHFRDNDNIYMGRLEHCLEKAMKEGIKRLKNNYDISLVNLNPKDIASLLKNPNHHIEQIKRTKTKKLENKLKVSQIVGQPASSGIASGSARVIREKKDLFNFKKDEILVVDAIDPTMTFVIPLCAGIIERRGGMLIHGAIIAREYDIPCITGIVDATNIIQTGDYIHIDGDNGIVRIQSKNRK
jgi:pyruvate,water dikinase